MLVDGITLENGTDTMSIADLANAHRIYDTDAVVAFKQRDPVNLRFFTDLSTGELQDMFTVGDESSIGYYTTNSGQLDGADLESTINDFKELIPLNRPLHIMES